MSGLASLVRLAARELCRAAIAISSLTGCCASPSELVTITNDPESASRVAIIFGVRTGFAPTGLIAGLGARCKTLAPGETWIASADGGDSLVPIHSALSATTILIRPPTDSDWCAYLVSWGGQDSRDDRGRREVRISVHTAPDRYRVEAMDQNSRQLRVTPIEASTWGDAATWVRRWMNALE